MLDRWIGNYRLLEKLGAGGMGEVYRAVDTRLNRHVALKVLSPDHAHRPHSLERFRREACAVAALNHPNIVTIYSVEEHEGLHFLTMELVQGRTLSSLIPREGLPLRRLLEIAVPLAEALEAAHERGIVHRDLKPANVMVSHSGRIKVLDFGIAKSEPDAGATLMEGEAFEEETLTGTGHIVGTPAYMSPEQALGRPVDHRTDLFSFGVVLYEMATGCRPFRGEGAGETFAALLRDAPPKPSSFNPRVPGVLDDLIASCLEKDVSHRVQSARDLRQSLQALAAGLSTPSIPLPTDTGHLTRLRRRWRTPAAAFAVTGCLVLMLAATRPRLDQFLEGPATPAMAAEIAAGRRPALAVLPLGNFSNDPEYFVDGMTDALISSLGGIEGVRVISRQSVMRYKRSAEPLPEIARQLGVDVVVQGSVMRADDRVRITAQLIRADPEQQIWTKSYERDLRDVLSLQHEVARAISQEIQVKLGPGDRRRLAAAQPVNPDAYDAYLKGRFALNLRTSASFATARQHFEEALRRDPGFAPAHAGLADLHCLSAHFGLAAPEAAYPQARVHAQSALKLDPELADAHVSLGLVQLFAERDWQGSEASFRKAIALRPNHPVVHHYFTYLLLARGRWDEGLEQVRLHHELDPLSPSANVNLGTKAYYEGRPDEALKLFRRAQELAPDFHSAYQKMSDFYRLKGDERLEFENFRKMLALRYPEIVPALEQAYRERGRKGALEAAAAALEDLARTRGIRPEDLARVYMRLDERDKALDCLEVSYRRGFPGALLFGASEKWDWNTLSSEPRFRSLVQRIGSSGLPGPGGGGKPLAGCRSAPPDPAQPAGRSPV